MKKQVTTLVSILFFMGWSPNGQAQLLNNISKKLEKKADEYVSKKINELDKEERNNAALF